MPQEFFHGCALSAWYPNPSAESLLLETAFLLPPLFSAFLCRNNEYTSSHRQGRPSAEVLSCRNNGKPAHAPSHDRYRLNHIPGISSHAHSYGRKQRLHILCGSKRAWSARPSPDSCGFPPAMLCRTQNGCPPPAPFAYPSQASAAERRRPSAPLIPAAEILPVLLCNS